MATKGGHQLGRIAASGPGVEFFALGWSLQQQFHGAGLSRVADVKLALV
jgi:hypothetical protein